MDVNKCLKEFGSMTLKEIYDQGVIDALLYNTTELKLMISDILDHTSIELDKSDARQLEINLSNYFTNRMENLS